MISQYERDDIIWKQKRIGVRGVGARRSRLINYRQCIVCTGYGIYFGFVAAFVWLNVMCVDIWWTFGWVLSSNSINIAANILKLFSLILLIKDTLTTLHYVKYFMQKKYCATYPSLPSESDMTSKPSRNETVPFLTTGNRISNIASGDG